MGTTLLALFGSVGVFHFTCLVLVLCQWPQLQLPGNPERMSFITATTKEEEE